MEEIHSGLQFRRVYSVISDEVLKLQGGQQSDE